MLSQLRITSLGLSIVAVLLGGCGSSEPAGTVSGTVTYQGQPVSEAIVTFVSAELGAGAEATLDSDGEYSITDVAGGLPPGEYKVTDRPPEIEDSSRTGPNSPPLVVPKVMPNVPQKYRIDRFSPLEVEVVDGDNEHNFELQD